MTFFRKQLGKSGEDLAADFLHKKGLKIIGRNIHFKFGEIDILAQDKENIVLVEVKTKTNEDFGKPYEEVDYFKKKKLSQLARAVLQKYPNKNIRVDVVSIRMDEPPEIEYIENAVEF